MKKKIALYIIIILIAIYSIFPVYWLINLSFMHAYEVASVPTSYFPTTPTLNNYLKALGLDPKYVGGHSTWIKRGIQNSLMLAFPTALLALAIAAPAASALGRINSPHKNKWLFLIIMTRSLPPISVVISYYIFYSIVGLAGTLIGLLVVHLSMATPLITWVLSGFFATLPVEMERAARIDGCSRLGALMRIVLPMGAPGIVACGLLAFLTSWNDFVYALVLTGGTPAQTLQPALAGMFQQVVEVELMAAANTLAMIPPFILALIFQKYIMNLRIVDPVTVMAQ